MMQMLYLFMVILILIVEMLLQYNWYVQSVQINFVPI